VVFYLLSSALLPLPNFTFNCAQNYFCLSGLTLISGSRYSDWLRVGVRVPVGSIIFTSPCIFLYLFFTTATDRCERSAPYILPLYSCRNHQITGWVGHSGEEKNLLPLPRIEQQFLVRSGRSIVTTLTETTHKYKL
jgi:hypothetical protein